MTTDSYPSTDNLPGTDAVRYGPDDRLIAMHAAHAAFRRDLRCMAAAATPANLRNPVRYQSIANGWQVFARQLHIHHGHEDRFLWPRLRTRMAHSDAAQSVLDDMDQEHSLIDPLLAAVEDAFQHPDERDVGAVLDELAGKLSYHLSHEERDAIPIIAEGISDAEWRSVVKDIRRATKLSSAAEFMPWALDGTSAEQAKIIASIMPPPARVVLKRVWRPRYEKMSRW